MRLLEALSGFPHGEGGLKEELWCGIGFTKSGSDCHSWKGLIRGEPEAQRGRGLSVRLHENERQLAELAESQGPPVQLRALSSRGERH